MHDHDHADDFEMDPIEGYCMRCRDSIEMENPQAVWTRRGMPATRGECPICGGTVFRMGKTELHRESQRPQAVVIGGETEKRKHPKLPRETVYVSYAPDDEERAQQIAADLEKSGLAIWLHESSEDEADVQWAGGVHPALKECQRMVLVLSPLALESEQVSAAWQFFREQRKPVVIAQIDAADPPNPIRRSPRFDFSKDYKRALRDMLNALSS